MVKQYSRRSFQYMMASLCLSWGNQIEKIKILTILSDESLSFICVWMYLLLILALHFSANSLISALKVTDYQSVQKINAQLNCDGMIFLQHTKLCCFHGHLYSVIAWVKGCFHMQRCLKKNVSSE